MFYMSPALFPLVPAHLISKSQDAVLHLGPTACTSYMCLVLSCQGLISRVLSSSQVRKEGCSSKVHLQQTCQVTADCLESDCPARVLVLQTRRSQVCWTLQKSSHSYSRFWRSHKETMCQRCCLSAPLSFSQLWSFRSQGVVAMISGIRRSPRESVHVSCRRQAQVLCSCPCRASVAQHE